MTASFFDPDARVAVRGLRGKRLDGRRVLVTGASGVVGVHIVAALRELAKCGCDVRVTAVIHSELPEPLSAVFQHRCCEVMRGDLCDPSFRKMLPAPDVVVHAAGYGQPAKFTVAPRKVIQLNSDATCHLLDHLRPGGKLLFVSSSELYTDLPAGVRYHEDQIGRTGPHHPRACYIEGKRVGETACISAFRDGVGAISVRLAQTYGPGARRGDRRALYSFIEQGLDKKRISLMDSGGAVRTYCYVADAVRMMLRILLEGTQPVYNVAGKVPITIRDLASQVAGLLGASCSVANEEQASAGAAECVMLDMSRYEGEFGTEEYVDLEAGLRRTVEWYRQPV